MSRALAEIEKEVRGRFPNYRVYDWRSVEQMREDVPKYAMFADRQRHALLQVESALTWLESMVEDYRSEKRFDVSDRIRKPVMEIRDALKNA